MEKKDRNNMHKLTIFFIQKELKACQKQLFKSMSKKTKVLCGIFDMFRVICLLIVKVRIFILNNKSQVVNFLVH